MNINQFEYENGAAIRIHMDVEDITRTLLDADIVVLEEIDTRVGGTYALQFLDIIEAEMAREKKASSGD